jgi:hypothetical protein
MQNKQRVTSKLWTIALGLAALIGFGGNVYASTPDGETPANEGVCDVVQGGTPGLYGLCVAYCEAQDLDLVGDKEPPNTKILANYRKKMRAGDPDMPCVQVPCPCWTQAELTSIVNNAAILGGDACTTTATTAQIRISPPLQFATADIGRTPALCRYTDRSVSPAISRVFAVEDAAAAKSCYDQVIAACGSLGQ